MEKNRTETDPAREESKNRIARDVSVRAGQADSFDMTSSVTCPMCGAIAVQEKCKLICRSEVCRGRVILNCSEF